MEKYFPFNAVTVDGVPDRVYTAEDFARERASYVTSGVTSPEGLTVAPAPEGGLALRLAAGSACLTGYTYWNDGALTLPLSPAPETYPRLDRAVLRLDLEKREIRAAVKTGEPGEEPLLPSLTRTAIVFELPLAAITVRPGQTEIVPSDITDQRPFADYILHPMAMEAVLTEYREALSAYFSGEDADALAAAARIVKRDKGAENVLCGDGAYRPLPAAGAPLTELCRFTESSVFYPGDYPVEGGLYTVVLQGGGGSGGRGLSYYGGSAGGYAVVQTLLPFESYAVTVGKGGAARYGVSNSASGAGNSGGETAFGPFKVPGGAGGKNGNHETLTVGIYTAPIGSAQKGADSLLGVGGASSSEGDAAPGETGAGGGACSLAGAGRSGAGGDGVVIVYGCRL